MFSVILFHNQFPARGRELGSLQNGINQTISFIANSPQGDSIHQALFLWNTFASCRYNEVALA